MEDENFFHVFGKVFTNKNYLFLAILTAAGFYIANVFFSNWNVLPNFYSSLGFFGSAKLFFSFALGFFKTVELHFFISLIVISLMFGILFSLICYKAFALRYDGNRSLGLFTGFAVFLGAFAPGCAACGFGLASTLGVGAAFLTFLPFGGFELSLLSIGLLGFSIIKVSKDLTRGNSCQINLKMKEINLVKGGKK